MKYMYLIADMGWEDFHPLGIFTSKEEAIVAIKSDKYVKQTSLRNPNMYEIPINDLKFGEEQPYYNVCNEKLI